MDNESGMSKALREAAKKSFPITKRMCFRDAKHTRRGHLVKAIMRQYEKEEREKRNVSTDT